MKRWVAVILTWMLLLGLTGCGGNQTATNGDKNATSKTITFDELALVFKKGGYQVEQYENVSEVGLAEIPNTTDSSVFTFYKMIESKGAVYSGLVGYYQFANAADAVTFFGNSVQGGTYTNYEYGRKYVRTEGDSEYGKQWILLQIDNVVILMSEFYDIDGNGTYNDGIEEIIKELGL